jgi:hypothetical protein
MSSKISVIQYKVVIKSTFVVAVFYAKYLITSTPSTTPATDKPTMPIKVATPFKRTYSMVERITSVFTHTRI